ncbi:MAG: transglycosylase domain-containing protein, partial [Bdellovibrionales bacterium]|nr:transglycosylase domain-containing protein [Bdellovibrionales bacterium]
GSLPSLLASAVLAQEDRRFFEHRGIDFEELWASLKRNIWSGQIIRGASTIDMQVASLCYPDYSLTRFRWLSKFREALLALFLNRVFSKSQTLEMYLVAAPLGEEPIVTGFPEASNRYYSSRLSELGERQIWSLVTTLRNREYLNPNQTRDLRLISERTNRKLLSARETERILRARVTQQLRDSPWLTETNG